jgi:hypothetical protein
MNICSGCQTTKEQTSGQWWDLRNYHGIRGLLCPACTDMIQMDASGKPNNPKFFTFMLLKTAS